MLIFLLALHNFLYPAFFPECVQCVWDLGVLRATAQALNVGTADMTLTILYCSLSSYYKPFITVCGMILLSIAAQEGENPMRMALKWLVNRLRSANQCMAAFYKL